jgi:SPP1 family predicted phage head-tail adaptor
VTDRARNRLVTIKSRTAGEDAAGQPINTWTVTVVQTYASVRYLSGLETIKGGAEAAVSKASIRIGYRTNVTPDMRVELGSTVFRIVSVQPDEARRDHVDLVVEAIA